MKLNDLVFDDARKELEDMGKAKKSRQPINYVRLKEGEHLRGYLLTTDFKKYMCHNDRDRKIVSHACRNPNDRTDAHCISCEHGVNRYKKAMIPFWNVDSERIEVFDAASNGLEAVLAFVREYEEDSTTTPVMLIRTGSGKYTTNYTLKQTRVKPAEKDLFIVPNGLILDNEFYLATMNVKEDKEIAKIIGVAV